MYKTKLNLRHFRPCEYCDSLSDSMDKKGIIFDIPNQLVLYKASDDVYIYAHVSHATQDKLTALFNKVSLLGMDENIISLLRKISSSYVLYNRSEVSYYISEADFNTNKLQRNKMWG
ncbi:MAG: hypothetical protein ACRDD8_14270 [Bacteroidales bacterium]